ncbi:hypothetical protein ACLKA6_018633 [Drosophila palustris]
MPSVEALSADQSTRPVIVWNGAQYTASSRELELELLRREYGLDERMLEATLVPRYKRHKPQASARNAHVRQASTARAVTTASSVSPASASASSSSDWILRQGNSIVSQVNFHPWTELGERKFSHFDLVPWRRTRSALDLSSALDYSRNGGGEGVGAGGRATAAAAAAAAEKSLRGLEKLELRHNRRRLQRARSTQQGLRRLVRVRLIFSIELRHKRMELLRQSALPMRVFEQRFALSENESAAYERILLDANAGVEQHVGYFSRRQGGSSAADDDEQLVVDFASETEVEAEGEAAEAEAQYATIATGQESEPTAEKASEKSVEKSVVEASANENGTGEEIETGKGSGSGDATTATATKVPCVKCRDVAIKLSSSNPCGVQEEEAELAESERKREAEREKGSEGQQYHWIISYEYTKHLMIGSGSKLKLELELGRLVCNIHEVAATELLSQSDADADADANTSAANLN